MKMSSNIIRNFLSKSATRLYPYQVREPFENSRYELYNDIDNCIFCKTCEKKCPSQCITVDKHAGVWECDPFACIFCSICVEACPTNCLHQKITHRAPSTEREMIHMEGTPPKPKKKKKAAKTEEAQEDQQSQEADKDDAADKQ